MFHFSCVHVYVLNICEAHLFALTQLIETAFYLSHHLLKICVNAQLRICMSRLPKIEKQQFITSAKMTTTDVKQVVQF